MSLEPRSISKLLVENDKPARYWIPAYQRGYRWKPQQVTQLLDDIWEFIQDCDGKDKSEFYCLQPLVVKKLSDGRIEIVDGQQRLTTIYVLLKALLVFNSPKVIDKNLDKKLFSIEYETREDSGSFLKDIDQKRKGQNIDFYHIFEARNTIESWLRNLPHENDSLNLIRHLLNSDEAGYNIKFIWYELDSGDDSVEAFTRLNVGKIPLTDAELVRALFLRRPTHNGNVTTGNLSSKIAYEWDQIEKRLQDDSFWCFLQHPKSEEGNRIDLIFSLDVLTTGKTLGGTDFEKFIHYNAEFSKPNLNVERKWKKVKKIFMSLEEWYEDRFLFHVLGFVFDRSKGNLNIMSDLLKLCLNLDKSSFARTLRERIWRMLLGSNLADIASRDIDREISEFCLNINYKDSEKIRGLLLLFNLATLLRDSRSNIRFQFDSFKQQSWDIEHIRPVSENRPMYLKHQKEWLKQCLEFLQTTKEEERKKLADRINTYLNQDENHTSFEELDGEILSMFNESEDSQFHDDDLANLTLLDSHTNRVYKDAVFPVKRHILLKHDRSGIFVPLCTRNVFLKCYSQAVGDIMLWTPNDAMDYINEICETLTWFFGGKDKK